ncbi:MAG: GTF2I repeat domain-containing protein [Actinomycetota bacterium]|nr:GTF2I repeat domain-containing protein [Actinomycetota bacterium]
MSESAARAGSQGGLYDTPGSFHTIEINPANPSDALEIAHGYGLLQADPASVVVSELPESVFQQMLDQGLATVEKVPGLGEQTVFHPPGYDVFNSVSNRYFFTLGGG